MLMLLFTIWLMENFRRKHTAAVSHACVKMFVYFYFVFINLILGSIKSWLVAVTLSSKYTHTHTGKTYIKRTIRIDTLRKTICEIHKVGQHLV